MGISDREYDKRLSFGGKINPVVVLIAIAMIIFVALAFFKALTYLRLGRDGGVTGYFSKNILSWFALSGSTKMALTRPWTVLSYAFTHTEVWPLIANMVWLWCFGFIFTDITGFKKVVSVFIYGSLAGAAAYLMAGNLMALPGFESQYLSGSSAGILAICIAATTVFPTYKVFPMVAGGVSLWILSIIFLVLNIATLPSSHPVLYITYLAGALSGFLFIFTLRRGFDGSDWMNNFYDWLINLFNPEKPRQKRKAIKSTLFYNASQEPYSKSPKLTQKRIDELLDKIGQKGYESLSFEEKEFLQRASREDLKGK